MTDHDPIDELLGGLRTDVPEMSDKAFAVGRARLQTLVAPSPVASEPGSAGNMTPLRKRRLLRSPPGKLIATAAAAVVLAVGVVAGQAVWSGDNAPTASAAEQLNTAADNIRAADKPQPGQFTYTGRHSWRLQAVMDSSGGKAEFAFLEEKVHEIWQPSGTQPECPARAGVTGERQWLIGDEEAAKAAGLNLPGREIKDGDAYCNGTWPEPLPDDPEVFYSKLINGVFGPGVARDENGTISSQSMIAAVGVMLAADVPADTRAVLYEVLARVPGIEVTEQVANLDGQKGTAYGLSENGQRYDVIIDPATGKFIGEREISENGHAGEGIEVPPGTVTNYTSVTGPTVVDKAGATS